MKVFVGFLAGIGVGMWVAIFYNDGLSVGQIFSERVEAAIHTSNVNKRESVQVPISDLSQITNTSNPTLTPTSEPTKAPTPTPKPNPTLTPLPTLTETPKPVTPKYSSSQISEFVERFSGQYGVDPNVMRAIALCESGFDASKISRNGLYYGLYQFSVAAWRTTRLQMGRIRTPT